MKQKLIFDTTDANTISDSDSVGAYLRASDGTLLTHTDVGGKKALDVRLAEGVNVEVDLSHVDDSVRLGDGTSFFTSTSENGDVALDVHISNTEIAVVQGSDAPWSIDDNGGSITVDAVDLDIRDLTHVSDSVKIGDGTDFLAVEADGSINVNIASIQDAALANTAIAAAANSLDVANTAEDVVTSPLANRKYLFIYNNGNREAYIGQSGVSAANGFPLLPGAMMELRAGAAIDIEWVSSNTSQQLRTLELS